MGKKNPKNVVVQVVRGWREGGRVLSPGDRITVLRSRAVKMERLGYAVIIDPEAPYKHPATKKEHQFQEVDFDEPEVIPDKAKVELKKDGVVIREGEVEHVHTKVEKEIKEAMVEENPKPIKPVKVPQVPSLNDLTFLNKSHIKALKRNGIQVLSDVQGWDLDGLTGINGVSRKTSQKLLDAFNHHLNRDHHKESDMGVKTK